MGLRQLSSRLGGGRKFGYLRWETLIFLSTVWRRWLQRPPSGDGGYECYGATLGK